MSFLFASLRVSLFTIVLTVAGYTAVVLGIARIAAPQGADGSLIVGADGRIVGSRLIAQRFTEARYFWPRPSAVDYDAAGAGGSNLSAASGRLGERAAEQIARHGASPDRPLPPELATASGSGLDPHLSEQAALYQAPRVAAARGLPPAQVEALVRQQAHSPGGPLTRDRIVNVLLLNLALDGIS